jgi:phosphodiesterase/alkaline phosphatase D-like protein
MEKELFDFYSGFGFGADLILEALGTEMPCSQVTPYSSQTPVSADLTGLTMETAYTYRVVAANSNGPAKGGMQTVTPHAVYGISTDPATDVSQTEATLHGSFDPKNDDTHYFFEWGTDTSYGNVSADPPLDAGSTAGNYPAVFTLEGLLSFTTYHYRVVATNSKGTSHGLDRTFTTEPPLLPAVGGTTVSDLASTGATLGTEITPGYGDTVYLFEYGPTPDYGSATELSESVGSDNSPHTVSTAVTGLAPATTYYVRAVATNFGGTTHGTPTTFTTPSLPQIESAVASELAPTTARLGARVSPGFSPTTVHFEYGTGPRYGLRTPETAAIGSDNAPHEIGTGIAGLAAGTTYHFRVVATNAVGTVSGPDQTFSTPGGTASSGGGQQTTGCNVSKLEQSAHRYAARAKQLRRRGLEQRAAKADREAKRLSAAAKRCRRNLRRAT